MALNSFAAALLKSAATNDPNAGEDLLDAQMGGVAVDPSTLEAIKAAAEFQRRSYEAEREKLRLARTQPSALSRLNSALSAAIAPARNKTNWDTLRQGLAGWDASGEKMRSEEQAYDVAMQDIAARENMSLAELAAKYGTKAQKPGGGRKVATNPVTGEYYLTDIQEGEPSVVTLGRPGAPATSGAKVVTFKDPRTGRESTYIEETNLKGETRREPLKEAPRTAEEEVQFQAEVEAGKRRNAARAALPKLIADVNYSVGLIDKALSHPGLSAVVGFPDPFKGGFGGERAWPGSDAASFLTIQKQLAGQQFLAAYESLKGTGQITQIEGEKATAAMARLQTAQSEAEFKAALQELRGLLLTGLQRTRQSAGPAQGAAPAQSKPAAGAPAQTLRYDPKTKSFQPVK